MKRCIMISILDFNLTAGEEYHNVYCLRNIRGELFSDLLEIHILELAKALVGSRPEDNWIRLLNVGNTEKLDMIKTMNLG